MHHDASKNLVSYNNLAEMLPAVRRSWRYDHVDDPKSRGFAPRLGPATERLMMEGCPASAQRAAALIEQFDDEIESSSWQDEATVAGCYPVVAEFLQGDPECMRMPTLVKGAASPLTIFVDLTSSWNVMQPRLERRGAAIMALVQRLSAQRPVTLQVGLLSTSPPSRGSHKSNGLVATAGVKVSIETAPLDLASTAFVMSDASCQRRLFFAAAEAANCFGGSFPGFLSKECGNDAQGALYARLAAEALDLEGECLYIAPTLSSESLVSTDPVAWIKAQVARFGQSAQY